MATQELTVNTCGVVFTGKYVETNDFTTIPVPLNDSWMLPLGSGTGSGNANVYIRKRYMILASATETINLKSLIDDFSNTITTLSKLKVLMIRLFSSVDAAASIKVGGTASGNNFTAIFDDATDKIGIFVNGVRFFGELGAGFTVDATHRNLDIVNQSAIQSVVVDVRIIGEK